ncbi:hypothetical protein A0U40_08830 [[Bacillus] sp. KCTC 13219]|nr:hypothetical protein A0U40_08830 [[Bacillus] sp. KCTC 13219]
MQYGTLPNWFWIIYYLFLFITIITARLCIKQRKLIVLSVLTIFFAITVPIISFIHSIERKLGEDELHYFISRLQQGDIWTVYVILGYLYILIWWGCYFYKKQSK